MLERFRRVPLPTYLSPFIYMCSGCNPRASCKVVSICMAWVLHIASQASRLAWLALSKRVNGTKAAWHAVARKRSKKQIWVCIVVTIKHNSYVDYQGADRLCHISLAVLDQAFHFNNRPVRHARRFRGRLKQLRAQSRSPEYLDLYYVSAYCLKQMQLRTYIQGTNISSDPDASRLVRVQQDNREQLCMRAGPVPVMKGTTLPYHLLTQHILALRGGAGTDKCVI